MNWDFQQWLIIALMISLFFKEEARAIVRNWFKLPLVDSQPSEKLQASMDYLKMHFNDELTSILTEMQVDMKEGINEQRQGFTSVKDKQDYHKDLILKVNNYLENFDKYGVIIRK